MEHLSEHLDKWTKLVADYGQEIAMHAPKQLRVMLMEILPAGLEEELEHPLNTHIKTCEQIVEWCKAKTLKSRQKLLASQKLKNLNLPGGRMAPLTPGDSWGQTSNSALDEAPPSWAAPLIAALAKHAERGRPKGPRGNSRDRRGSSPSLSARQRSVSPNSGFKPKGSFVWRGGCNHCNDKDHKRHECPKFKTIKDDNGVKLPEGYKGVREVAYEKWRNNQKNRTAGKQHSAAQIKALKQEPDTASEDSDFSESELMPIINSSGIACGLWEPVTKGTKLEDAIVRPKATYIAADGYGTTAWEALQDVAPRKTKSTQHVVVKSEKDLDQLLARHPTLAALPSDAQARKELAKLSPKSRKYVYVMMDSGASLNAANLKKKIPWLANQLRPNDAQRRGAFANTANGEKLHYEGEFTVDGDCDGVPLSLNFTNMKVDVPIASVRKFVKSGNDVAFYEGGGCIVNRESKEKVKFDELGGVYFLKVRVNAEPSTLGFARPVR